MSCGSDDKSTSSTATTGGTATGPSVQGERTSPPDKSAQAPAGTERPRPTRRDTEVESQLERHLRQEAAGVASGWRFADVDAVHVRSTSVVIETRLGPGRREGATGLCLAARRFFEQGNQRQTPYDVLVRGRGDSALASC